ATVEAGPGAEPPPERHQESHPPAEAEPDDADPRVVPARGVQVLACRVDVDQDAGVVGVLAERKHLRQVTVRCGAASRAVPHARRLPVCAARLPPAPRRPPPPRARPARGGPPPAQPGGGGGTPGAFARREATPPLPGGAALPGPAPPPTPPPPPPPAPPLALP